MCSENLPAAMLTLIFQQTYWYFVYYYTELVTCASAAASCSNYEFLK